MKEKLSIGIPTYNRPNQLKKQLNSILCQDLEYINEIIIVDNHSDYDVYSLIKEFNTDKIRLIINPFNLMMSTNLGNPFLYCNTEWLWLLSDDDETYEGSIKKIISAIENVKESTGMIKFPLNFKKNEGKIFEVESLEEFIDYYYNDPYFKRGDLVFMSNAIYNINNLKPYLGYLFEFSYTYISYLIPVFVGLNNKNITVAFANEKIVKYLPPADGGWKFSTVSLGLSNISHLPLNLSNKYYKRFLNITMTVTYPLLFKSILANYDEKNAKKYFKIIYNNVYTYYLSFIDKIIANTFIIILKNNWLVLLLKKLKAFTK